MPFAGPQILLIRGIFWNILLGSFFSLVTAQSFLLQFPETRFDFGTIGEKGGLVYHVFTFSNPGPDSVWIQSATGACHCTTGEFPKEGIPPGGKGFVRVVYNPLSRPWEFESSVEIKLKGKPGTQELKIAGKTIGGAETIRFEPAEYTQKFEYNEKSIEAGESAFRAFVEKLVPLIEKHAQIKVQIESSASNVPTKTYSNNTELTQQRARDARAKMLEILTFYQADLSRIEFLDDISRVQGPAYSKDYKRQIAKYLPFQYVKIRVF
jgi:hypothetical protein